MDAKEQGSRSLDRKETARENPDISKAGNQPQREIPRTLVNAKGISKFEEAVSELNLKEKNCLNGNCVNSSKKKRSVSEVSEKNCSISKLASLQNKNSADRKSIRSTLSISLSTNSKEKKQETKSNTSKGTKKTNHRLKFLECTEAVPLLKLTAVEQKKIIDMLRTEKEQFRKKLTEVKDLKVQSNLIESCQVAVFSFLDEKNSCSAAKQASIFEESYYIYLDEILHVWINLFYFIINLRVNLIKLLNISGKETFTPNAEFEKHVMTRAVGCVKFFSVLKLKSLAECLGKFQCIDNSNKSKEDILQYEEQISDPFLIEMEFMGRKAIEILTQIKKQSGKRKSSVH